MFWLCEGYKDIVLKSSSNAGEDSNHVKLKAYLLHHSAMQVDICSHLLQTHLIPYSLGCGASRDLSDILA